jgi:transcriptional regulator with XRE-family HTH domain
MGKVPAGAGNPMIQESEIGKRIKAFRMKKGLTQQDLAQKTGFTKGYLSKVENTEKAPPVSTLIVIAKALNISISDIFGETADRDSACLVKKHERPVMMRDGTVFGYAYQMLAHKFYDKHMQPYVLTLPKDVTENALFRHKGEEMLFVLEGRMRFYYGENEYVMEEGDCLYFDADIPHYGICHGKKEVKCLMVIYTPE